MQWFFSPYLPSLLAGPSACQLLHLGKATHCALPYCIRLIFTRLLTLYYIFVYELSKKNTNFKKVIFYEIVMEVSCTAVFLCVDKTLTSKVF